MFSGGTSGWAKNVTAIIPKQFAAAADLNGHRANRLYLKGKPFARLSVFLAPCAI